MLIQLESARDPGLFPWCHANPTHLPSVGTFLIVTRTTQAMSPQPFPVPCQFSHDLCQLMGVISSESMRGAVSLSEVSRYHLLCQPATTHIMAVGSFPVLRPWSEQSRYDGTGWYRNRIDCRWWPGWSPPLDQIRSARPSIGNASSDRTHPSLCSQPFVHARAVIDGPGGREHPSLWSSAAGGARHDRSVRPMATCRNQSMRCR